MGADDKLEAKGDQLKGKVKEGVGDVTGDDKLEAEGQGDQVKGHVKEAAEKVKDIFKK
nr:CsbD family protein [Crossiella equi]